MDLWNFKEGKGVMALKSLAFAFGLFLVYFILGLSTAQAEITVYDDDGQYLGVLLGAQYDYTRIFIPATGKFCSLGYREDMPEHSDVDIIPECYETSDCTGPSYIPRSFKYSFSFIAKTCLESYVTNGKLKVVTLRSRKFPDYQSKICECREISDGGPETVIEIVPTNPPPFNLPVSLPFRYEHSTLGVEKVVIGPPE